MTTLAKLQAGLDTTDAQVEFDQQAELLVRAEALGIDWSSLRCPCECCAMTSRLCTATLSAIESAIASEQAKVKP